MLSNDLTLPYEGEDFETVLINVVAALNYVLLNQWDDALVEARKVDHKLNVINDRYDKKNVYKEDAFARYLSGILYEGKGELNDAFIERVVPAILAGTSAKDVAVSPEKRNQLAQDIYDRGREAVVVLPPGYDLKLVEATANTENIFNAQIKMANTAIAILVRGGNLTTEISDGAGSRAASETQERLGDDAKLAFDNETLTTTIHDQSLVWWAEFNFADRTLAPWPAYPIEAEEDLKSKVATELQSFDALQKAEALGFEVDREAFLREHGIEWAKPGVPKIPVKPTATPLTAPIVNDPPLSN